MFDKKKDAETTATPGVQPTPGINSSNARSASATTGAMIGASIRIQGDISGAENLLIHGKVEGKISLQKNDVTVGQAGQINADISAKTIRIDGEVNGDINGAEKVVITSTGRVRGNIVAPRMTLEDGAKFKGSIDMDPDESAKSASEKTQKPSPVAGGHS